MQNLIYSGLASKMRTSSARCFLLAVAQFVAATGIAQAQCGSNPDFIVGPDGTSTPTIVRVISTTVDQIGGDGIGNMFLGSPNGAVTQTQTLRIASTGRVFPNNVDTCTNTQNEAGVFIEKTAILDMQGGHMEPINLAIVGPEAGDAALGGIFKGFGTFKAAGPANAEAIHLESATLNPLGILSLDASREENGSVLEEGISLNNSTFRVMIGASPVRYLNIIEGNLALNNTELVVDFPSGFTPTSGQQFTLVKFGGTSRTGFFTNTSGASLPEGATVSVNGIAMKISYVGGTGGKDIVLKAPVAGPTISVNDRPNAEGSAATPSSTTFTMKLSAASASTITVNFQTADGTAKAGGDYTAKSGKVTFAPGEIVKKVTILFIGDSVAELNETMLFKLNTPTNATIADGQGIGTLLNDDGPSISIENAANINEGNSGTVAQKFIVRLSAASTNTVTASWATSDGTATTADYTAATGALSFAPGQTSKLITILVKGDTLVEPNETYKVTLSNLKYAIFDDSQAVGIILNDD